MSLSARVNLAGRRFGRLAVLEFVPRAGTNRSYWRCRCDCGAEREIKSDSLLVGDTKSCGCLSLEILRRGRPPKHGMRHLPEYGIWVGMVQRCHAPDSKDFFNYGGRGIVVCQRWRDDFTAFYADMGPRPSRKHQVDRRDNDGPYEPGNCRWELPAQQQRNKRTNHLLTHNGRTMTLVEWSELMGLPRNRLGQRLDAGWSIERALTAPVSFHVPCPTRKVSQ